MNNCTSSTLKEFSISGFQVNFPDGEIFFFIVLLLMYLLIIVGNLTIVTLICVVSQLHTPMYFFLCNLSSADIAYVTVTLPKLLSIFFTQDHKITFRGCITQLYFFLLCGQADIFILTCMAYDRYVAICKPLQYTLIMNKGVCIILAAFSWLIGILNSLLHALLTSSLPFCHSNKIDHFFCDLKTLSMLSASDSKSRDILTIVQSIFIGCVPFLLIVVSYVYIISTILKMQSSNRRLKAFSSCSSHLTTVILFYGPIIFLYMKPENDSSRESDKLLSILYVAVVPMLNPLVYSLRNKDVLGAIGKIKQHFEKVYIKNNPIK